MKESDYCDVGDMKCLMHAQTILSHIVVANQPIIDADEFAEVMRRIDKWKMALLKKMADESEEG